METLRFYFPPIVAGTLLLTAFLWFQFYALPRIQKLRREEEEAKRLATAAPESHSKSSE